IAERLAVTKAALYYHFKSKEDIVASLVEDYFGQVDALIVWARAQPGSAGTRAEILRRYVSIVAEGDEVFRMLHQNQAAVNTLASAKGRGELFRERLTALTELLTGPAAGGDGAGRGERRLDVLRRPGDRPRRAGRGRPGDRQPDRRRHPAGVTTPP